MFVSNMRSTRTGNEVANQFVLFFSNAQVFSRTELSLRCATTLASYG